MKEKFKHEICNPLRKHISKTYAEARPKCAEDCQDEATLSCAHFHHVWTKEGGCAHSCSAQDKAEFEAFVCSSASHWGQDHVPTVEEEEEKLEKFDKVVVGAEAMAGYPDSIHTAPPKEDEDPDLGSKRAMMAMCLLCVCCGWCCCCFWFHKWALTKKKAKLLEGNVYDGEDS
jgi:hypothetical protein